MPQENAASTYLGSLLEAARRERVWQDRAWRLLLHYEKTWLGSFRSEADSKFFLFPSGKTDPQAELEATLTAFFQESASTLQAAAPSQSDQHPQCRFPARYAWLKARLDLDASKLPGQDCPAFKKWRDTIGAGSVTLVFASTYLDNAASMYGHTFLRLDDKNGAKNPLLNYALNFGAETRGEVGFLYAIRGLTGGYAGRFKPAPYYLLIQEYSHVESRDLWEYPLRLEPGEVERLIQHAWELREMDFPYYFLKKNCSYQLLPILEVAASASDKSAKTARAENDPRAAPRFKITPDRASWMIPADTVRILQKQPGLLGEPKRRASHLTTLRIKRRELSVREAALAKDIVDKSTEGAFAPLRSLPAQRQAAILDAAEEYLLYRSGYRLDSSGSLDAREREILVRRSKLPTERYREEVPPPKVLGKRPILPADSVQSAASTQPSGPKSTTVRETPNFPSSPDRGHPTARIGLGAGATRDSTFEEISWRGALHDLLDPSEGYTEGHHLEMGHLRLRYDRKSDHAYLQELVLFRMLSLSPWDDWIRRPTWNIDTGLDVAEEPGNAPWRSLYYKFNLGGGLAFQTSFWRQETFYALLQADLGLGSAFRDDYRLGGGPAAGILLAETDFWRAQFEAAYLGYALGGSSPNFRLSLGQHVRITQASGLRLNLEKRGPREEIRGAWVAYF
ncbi:MAG: DUF4105 domain-containing protein [Elusimicrobia bacterium]|nr:DUF4105 domain-containing protein [Elusimicrobiota bacterium]